MEQFTSQWSLSISILRWDFHRSFQRNPISMKDFQRFQSDFRLVRDRDVKLSVLCLTFSKPLSVLSVVFHFQKLIDSIVADGSLNSQSSRSDSYRNAIVPDRTMYDRFCLNVCDRLSVDFFLRNLIAAPE
jgi:hypothetical protein